MSTGCISVRKVCTVIPLPCDLQDWSIICTSLEAMSRNIGYSTARCSVEAHYLRVTDLRLQGIGTIESTLIQTMESTLEKLNISVSRIQVDNNALIVRCNRRAAAPCSTCVYVVCWIISTFFLYQSHIDIYALGLNLYKLY
jgi:hypothetical protein